MSDTTYNGWTNYETWATGLYLDGNYTGEGTYREVLDLVREHAPDVYAVAVAFEAFVDEEIERHEIDGLALDLLRAAADEINWRELAESKISEISES